MIKINVLDSLTCTKVVDTVCDTTVLSSVSFLILNLGMTAGEGVAEPTSGSCLTEAFEVVGLTLSELSALSSLLKRGKQ